MIIKRSGKLKLSKKALTAVFCSFSVALSSCSALNFTVDGLLNAPKLTAEQSEIHQALISSVGDNITIKYPKNGKNRSAYVVANIDDEPGEEAIAFYKYNSGNDDDNGVRVNLLDKDSDGNWYSVKELAGAGTDIDRVILSDIGENSHLNVLVGFQSVSEDTCALEVYNYDGSNFKRIGVDSYSLLETADINSDGKNEIITIREDHQDENGTILPKACTLTLEDGRIKRGEEINMYTDVDAYADSKVGKLSDNRTALFIDSLNTQGNLQTELIYYRYSRLQNPMCEDDGNLINLCTRPLGYYCEDIDRDGEVEIPTVSPMTGYENAIDDEMVYMTSFNSYEDFYSLKEKYNGYYCLPESYFIAFPKRWSEQVTVKKDTRTGETVFFKYTGDINSNMVELMRIKSCQKNQSGKYIDDGYELIDSSGQTDYLVLLPGDKREKLILTIDEVKNNFYIID